MSGEKAAIDQGVEPGFQYQDLCITGSILNIDKFLHFPSGTNIENHKKLDYYLYILSLHIYFIYFSFYVY